MKYENEIQPETIVKIYREDGIEITMEQARGILEFLYMLANIALDNAEKEINKLPVKSSGKFGRPSVIW